MSRKCRRDGKSRRAAPFHARIASHRLGLRIKPGIIIYTARFPLPLLESPSMNSDIPHDELRLWTKDEEGRFVLRGLTAEETEWHQAYADKELAQRLGDASRWPSQAEFEADRTRWLALKKKHELARASTIFAEEKQRSDAEPVAKFKRKSRY
jgi:hypothetical protein